MNPVSLHKISYGLYVVCSKNKEKMNGQIANAIFQVTSKPPTIAVSINTQNLTHDYIKKSKIFTISVLSEETPMKFIGNFGFKSGRIINKFENVNYKLGKTNVPVVLENAVAYIELKVVDEINVGTHTIFIGRVEDAEILTENNPMTYEYYHKCKGGYSPKTAPTYSKMIDKKEIKKENEKMDKYVCKICGYVYEPEIGDPDNGIEAGTRFEDLPEDWTCPVCGAGKKDFEKQ
jgi:flavin reductase (DIM6/NTAB) family NADH-FMN oxidoreductase RutF/rubredoxin